MTYDAGGHLNMSADLIPRRLLRENKSAMRQPRKSATYDIRTLLVYLTCVREYWSETSAQEQSEFNARKQAHESNKREMKENYDIIKKKKQKFELQLEQFLKRGSNDNRR